MRLWIEKIAWLPPLVGGAFVGRWAAFATALLLERRGTAAPAGVLLAITLLFSAAALLLWDRTQRPPAARLWPLLLALPYLFLPAERPLLAAGTVLTVLLALAMDRNLPRTRRPRFLPPALVALTALLLYGATLMPGVLPADSGEFQLRAAQLGVAHPTGFPLYTLTAHLITRLPLPFSAAAAVNAYSLLLAVVTLLLVYSAAEALSESRLSGLLAAAALGAGTTFWSQATTANIRMPTALLAAAAFYLTIRWTRRKEPLTERQVALFGVLMLLSVTHHVSLGFMGLLFGVYLVWHDPSLLQPDRRWIAAVGGAALGCLPLLYFPLRAGAPGAPGDIDTLPGLLNHVLGLGFRGDLFYFRTPADLWDRIQIMGSILALQFTPLLLVGGGLGWALLLRNRDRETTPPMAVLLMATFALHTFITATYRAPQTVEYMLPAYIPVALALGHTATLRRPRAVGVAVAALLLTAALGQVWQQYPSYRTLRQWDDATDYTNMILEEAPPNTIVLAGWHWATPLWYRQEIEGARPDLDVRYVFPTAEPYAATWARRIEEALAEDRPVVATHRFPDTYGALPPPLPLGDALLFSTAPVPVPGTMHVLDVTLGSAADVMALRGFRMTTAAAGAGNSIAVEIAWEALRPLDTPTTLFVHLAGSDDQLVAQADVGAVPRSAGVTITRFNLTPRPGTAPGAYTLLAGAYQADGDDIALLANAGGETRTLLATMDVSARQHPPYTGHPTYRPLIDQQRILVGYDWDNTAPDVPRLYLHWRGPAGYTTSIHDVPEGRFTLPSWRGVLGWPRENSVLENDGEFYVPFGQGIVWTGPLLADGAEISPEESILLRQWFQAGEPVVRDVAVSVRLVGYEPDGFTWAWAMLDEEFGVPAMGAVPTLKWIGGMSVLDLHRLPVPPTAEPGQESGALLTLYDTFTNRPVPVLDERFNPASPWRTSTVTP